MPIDATELDFLHYLRCDLPLGYPLKTPVATLLSPAQKSGSRRELLHRQSDFLDFAKQFLGTNPWFTYIAAIKHEAVLIAIPTFDEQLVDVVDKFFYRDLQEKCRELREASRAVLDEATALNCERLVLLQSEAAQIDDATRKMASAIKAGFTAVEPLPPPPPEPPSESQLLPWLIATGIGCIVAGALIPSYDGGMIWGVLGLVATVVWGARLIAKEKANIRAKGADFKAYILHEKYQILCRKSVELVLALPFEARKSALVNLPLCLHALQALPPERDALEAHYISAFVTDPA
jgi:hypothetical protein